MPDDLGTEESTDQTQDPAGNQGAEPDEQLVGDDESGYGGAARDPEDLDHVDPDGENRPPSEQDEDQGI